MARSAKPLLWTLLLLVAVSGWLYGWNWKRIATGGDTTHEERLIIDLQDQLDTLRAENQRLTKRLHDVEKAPAPPPVAPIP